MTAEEGQDLALQGIVDAKATQKADRAITAAKFAEMNQAQSDRDAAWAAYQVKAQALADKGYAWYLARNVSEGDDVVLVTKASQAYAEAMQNHGFIAT